MVLYAVSAWCYGLAAAHEAYQAVELLAVQWRRGLGRMTWPGLLEQSAR